MSPASNYADMDWSHVLPDSHHSGGAVQNPHSEGNHDSGPLTSHDMSHPTTTAMSIPDLAIQDDEHPLFTQHANSILYGRQTEPLFDYDPNMLTGVTPNLNLVVDQHDQDFASSDEINHTLGDVGQVDEWDHGFDTPYEPHPTHSLDEAFLQQSLPKPTTAPKLLVTLQQAIDHEPPPVSTLSLQQNHSMQLVDSHICGVEATADPKVFVFHCNDIDCYRKTFTRWPDFYRHYNGAHAPQKTVFWCPVRGCSRSEASNNRPFPRKDKLKDHTFKKHGMEGEIDEFLVRAMMDKVLTCDDVTW